MLKFLSSMKLAVFLIAAIAMVSVLATIFPDANAFQSWSFRLLVAAFFVNLSLCSAQLLPKFWKQLHRSAAQVPEQGDYLTVAADEAAVTRWLTQQRYAISRETAGDRTKILARKGTLSLWAPHILHLSILVILIGCMVSTTNTQGFVMGQVSQVRPFPEELTASYPDSSVEILDFQTTYDEQQAVDNWVTRFNLYVNGQLVAENVETKVNEPYRYGDMLIYQNSYDARYLIEIAGHETGDGTYGLPENQPVSVIDDLTFVAATAGNQVYLQVSDHKNPAWGQFVAPGDVLQLNDAGLTLTYLDKASYSVLELKTRKGSYIVFVGFLLATIASFLFFSGRYREIWILTETKTTETRIACFSRNSMVTEDMKAQITRQWSTK